MKALYNFKLTTPKSRNKNRLNKIHRLKKENRVLSDRRKVLEDQLQLNRNTYLKTIGDCIITGKAFNGLRESTERMFNKDVATLLRLSEQIGKNSCKIQRLRTQIQQEKAKMVQSKLHVRGQLKNMLRLSGIAEAELDSEVEKRIKSCYKGVQP